MANDHDFIFMVSNFNGHVGWHSNVLHGMHGGHGFCSWNEEGTRLLEFCDINDLIIWNANFRKSAIHLVTCKFGGHASQIVYVLTKKWDSWLLINAKAFLGKECNPQHRLLVEDLKLLALKISRSKPVWKRLWMLKDPLVSQRFRDVLNEASVEDEELETCS